MAEFTDQSIKAAAGLRDFKTLTGGSTKELQDWESAAQITGVAAGRLTETVIGLSESLEDFRTGKNAAALHTLATKLKVSLSVDPSKPFDLLNEIADSPIFHSMTAAERTQVLGENRIDPQLARFLLLSKAERRELLTMFPDMSGSDVDRFNDINKAMTEVHLGAEAVGRAIASWNAGALLTTMNAIVGAMKDFEAWYAKTHKPLTEEEKNNSVPWGHLFRPESRGRVKGALLNAAADPVRAAENMTPGLRAVDDYAMMIGEKFWAGLGDFVVGQFGDIASNFNVSVDVTVNQDKNGQFKVMDTKVRKGHEGVIKGVSGQVGNALDSAPGAAAPGGNK